MSNTGGGSNSASNSAPRIRKNAPGNRSDIGWKHGVDVQGNARKVKCNYCSKTINGGIYRFKHHLAGTKEDSEPCLTVPEEVKCLMIKVVAEAKETAKKKRKLVDLEENQEDIELRNSQSQREGKEKSDRGIQATINQMFKKDYKQEVDEQVAQFFYTSAIPFNCVKNPEFAKMCQMIYKYGAGYKPPSYHEMREKLLKKAVTKTDEMLEEFKEEWKRTGCTIMFDGWIDKKRRSICNFLVNSPKGTAFLYSLDTSDISKTTEKVFKMLDDVAEFVGEKNVVQVVTNNASNYKSVGEMLMQKRKNLYWTPCAAHCIDLILEDFEKHLKVHETTIMKGRKITTFIYARTMLITMLKKKTDGRDLIRPSLTRFATAYLTLSCLNDNKVALMNFFGSDEWKGSKFAKLQDGKKVQSTTLDSRFWKNVITCLKAAAPLIQVLRLVDSDEKPAMGFIYAAMESAKERIRANFNDVKKCYEPIWKIIDERWENQLHRPLHAAAYYLNPQYHFSPNFKGDNFEVKQGLLNCMGRLVDDKEERSKITLQIRDFNYSKGLFNLDVAKSHRQKMAPAEWWDFYGDGCPEFKRFAIRVLSLTCSSSGCERNWSSFEMVHTKRRNRLHQKKMNDLVYVMYNAKLKSRLIRKNVVLPFEEIPSDDEWITGENVEEEDVVLPSQDNHGISVEEVNVEIESSRNINLDGIVDNLDLGAFEEELDDEDGEDEDDGDKDVDLEGLKC